MIGFSKKQNDIPTIDAAFSEEELKAQAFRRVNSIVSDSLGIGIEGNDAIESIDVLDRQYFGTDARLQYRALDIVQRIIDSPAEDAIREGFEIKTNYDDLGINELMGERIKELGFFNKLKQWLIDTRLYSRGGLFYPVLSEQNIRSDRQHVANRLRLLEIDRILDLNVVPEDYFTYHFQQYDPLGSSFGDLDYLHINGQRVHDSRFFLHVNGLDIFRNRGISILDQIIVACKGLNIAEWTIAQLLLRYRSLIVKWPAAEAQVKDTNRKKFVLDLINTIKTQFTSKSVASIPDNYDINYLETKMAGLREGTDFLYEFLSTVSRVPQSIYKGSSKGELASSEKDQRDYYELVKSSEQEGKVQPMWQWFYPMLVFEREGKILPELRRNGIDPFTITSELEFNPMHSVNPLQDAQIKAINTQRVVMEVQNNLSSNEEGQKELYPERESMLAENGFMPDTLEGFELPQELMDMISTAVDSTSQVEQNQKSDLISGN